MRLMEMSLQTTSRHQCMDVSEAKIAEVLQYRFGDGLVYLPKHKPVHLYTLATRHGYIDQEGYMTRKGRILLARFQYL